MMHPLPKPELETDTDMSAGDETTPLEQLEQAQRRAEATLHGEYPDALAEGVRRAEAVLFAAGEPMSAEQIAEILPHEVEAAEVLMALRDLYANRGVKLVEVAGKWRFQTAPDLSYLFVEERQVQKKLGQAALETLAIISYGQPVTRAEVEAVRGVAVSKATLDTLQETGWVKMMGRRKTPGQPMTFGTTDAFLEHFGLESLDALPGKMDLEAEGLLTDAMPDGFQMPDEEALSEEGMMIDEAADVEESSFITDYMDDGEVVSETVEDVHSTDGNDVFAIDEAWLDEDPDMGDAGDADMRVAETTQHGDTDSSADDDDDDEWDDGSAVSVFAYTRDAADTEVSADANTPDAEDDTADDVEAAVARLARLGNIRQADRPMDEWDDED